MPRCFSTLTGICHVRREGVRSTQCIAAAKSSRSRELRTGTLQGRFDDGAFSFGGRVCAGLEALQLGAGFGGQPRRLLDLVPLQTMLALFMPSSRCVRVEPSAGSLEARKRRGSGRQRDAIDRTRRQAKLAPCAQIGNDGMHEFRCTQNRVHGTGLNAQCATDAACFVDDCELRRLVLPARRIEGASGLSRDGGEPTDHPIPSRRAAIDGCFAGGNRFCVGAAAVVAALSTLCLGQDCVDALGSRYTALAQAAGNGEHAAQHKDDQYPGTGHEQCNEAYMICQLAIVRHGSLTGMARCKAHPQPCILAARRLARTAVGQCSESKKTWLNRLSRRLAA